MPAYGLTMIECQITPMSIDLKSAYLLHRGELHHYVLRRVRDPHTAADLVQDAFAALAQQPMTKIQDVRAYLYKAVANLVIDQARQIRRRDTRSVDPMTLAEVQDDNAPSPEDAADSRLKLQRLSQMIDEMPLRTQQILILNRIDGLSYAEIAARLKISESSVQKHLAAALQHAIKRGQGR